MELILLTQVSFAKFQFNDVGNEDIVDLNPTGFFRFARLIVRIDGLLMKFLSGRTLVANSLIELLHLRHRNNGSRRRWPDLIVRFT